MERERDMSSSFCLSAFLKLRPFSKEHTIKGLVVSFVEGFLSKSRCFSFPLILYFLKGFSDFLNWGVFSALLFNFLLCFLVAICLQ